MNLDLQNKVALITGASRGIGEAIARRLAAENMRLALTARSEPDLRALAQEIDPTSERTLILPADLRDPAIPTTLIDSTLAHFGQLDLLVNNAGATRRGDFLALTDDDWHDGYALKFFGAMSLARAAWPHLAKTRGSIVNIAGIGGRTGEAEFTIGGSVNAALLNLTKSLAHKGTADHVRVNAINPGLIHTSRLARRITAFAQSHNIPEPDAAKKMAAHLGLARFGAPDEIAASVAFLASPASAYTHGAILDIDGGATRTL